MISLNNNIYEQTEEFEVHKNLSNNLSSDEEILYKLRSYKILFGAYEYHLYITNKRIILIEYAYKRDEEITSINLNELRGLSLRNVKKRFRSIVSGEIEFVSEDVYTRCGNHETGHYYRNSKFFPVTKNPQQVIKIINSIIWHYGNVNERISYIKNNYENLIPENFKDFFYTNKIFIPYKKGLFKKSSELIEFNQDLYLNYYVLSKQIVFRPNYLSSIKIRGKTSINYLRQLEIINLLSLYWKFKNHSLFDKHDLLELRNKWKKNRQQFKNKELLKNQPSIRTCYNCGAELGKSFNFCINCGIKQGNPLKIQEKAIIIKKERDKLKNRFIHSKERNFIQPKISKELYEKYNKYLNNDEKILLYYTNERVDNSALIIFCLFLIPYVSLFLMLFVSVWFAVLFVFSIIVIPLLIIINLEFDSLVRSSSVRSCVLTSQKIIFVSLKGIGITSYNNIDLITCKNFKKSESITFKLSNPIKSKNLANKIYFGLVDVPKNLNLYDKIIELRNQFKN
ncbi:MAG: PH domain-containing protein [Candidatus Hermodarchaeota archaeon]